MPSEFLNVFPNGLVLVREHTEGEATYTLRDMYGNIIMTTLYDKLFYLPLDNQDHDYGYRVTKGDLLGILNSNGKTLLPVIYEEIGRYDDAAEEEQGAYNKFTDPFFPVKRRGYWTFVRKEDYKEFTPAYKTILCSYKQGFAAVQDKPTELIFVNQEGREIWNIDTGYTFMYAEYIGNHYALVSKLRGNAAAGTCGIYDLDAECLVVPTEYGIEFVDYDPDTRKTYLRIDGNPVAFKEGYFVDPADYRTCPNYAEIIEDYKPRRRLDENGKLVNIYGQG